MDIKCTMKHILFIMFAIMLLIPTAIAATEIQISTDNITWYNITDFTYDGAINETTKLARVGYLEQGTMYYFRAKNSTTNWGYTNQRTERGFEEMELALTLFLIIVTGALFILPMFKHFSKNEFVNTILRRSCWVIGLWLLTLDTAMVATMASAASLGLNKEIFMYMTIIGWAAYLMMFFMLFRIMIDGLTYWKVRKENKRMGDDY